MKRAIKVTLKFATETKRKQIAALLEAYRAAVNFYIQSLWNDSGKLDKLTLARLENTRLSERYKSQALKQAIEIITATKISAKELNTVTSCPVFRGAAVLDAKFVSIEAGRGSFDLVIKLSILKKGRRISIPTRRTAVLNKWLAYPGAKLIQGCVLSNNELILWVELPNEITKADGNVLAVDIGVNKLLSDSEGNHYGKEFRKIRDKITRRKLGRKGRARAYKERENFINHSINKLPWQTITTIGVEALNDMKRGKKKGRGKAFRKAIAPWTYRRVLNRIEHKAQENRVLLVCIDPANTDNSEIDLKLQHCEGSRKGSMKMLRNWLITCYQKGLLYKPRRLIPETGSIPKPFRIAGKPSFKISGFPN